MSATAAYRQQLLKVRAGTYRDLLKVWPAFDPNDPRTWMTAAAAITRRDRARVALLTRAYLIADAQAVGRTITPAAPAELASAQLETSLRVTSLVAYRTARGAGKFPSQALQIAAVRSSGAATRLALNGGRSVVQQTALLGADEGLDPRRIAPMRPVQDAAGPVLPGVNVGVPVPRPLLLHLRAVLRLRLPRPGGGLHHPD